jgi:ADP-ribosylglycohydrolase
MIGAIAGDIIGSVYEGSAPPPKTFPLFVRGSRFTDDSVLTIAVASAIRRGIDYAEALRQWGRRYPDAGYSGWFQQWLWMDQPQPYHSYGNGSAMRVSAIGWAFADLETVLVEARRSAAVTHNHPEGIKGAQAAAAIAFLESSDFEDAVRNAISLGGDADTLACIAGALAEAFYGGTPDDIQRQIMRRLDEPLRAETLAFARAYGVPLCVEWATEA